MRANYFPGRLLTPEDLTREQEYHRAARRRLALATLGPGVVSGLALSAGPRGSVVVAPGYAIDRLGREIIVPSPATVPAAGRTCRWVVLEYAQELINPVAALAPNDPATDATVFEAVRETFRLTLRSAKPAADDPGGAIALGSRPPSKRA